MPASHIIQPAQQSQVAPRGQQQPRRQLTLFAVVDYQRAGPSGPFIFTLSLMKQFSPLSVASAIDGEVYTTYQDSNFLEILQSVMSYQQIDTPQLFSPSPWHQQATPSSHPSQSSSYSRPTALAYNQSFSGLPESSAGC